MTSALRVLVCEDGADLRTLLADVLREKGHILHEAPTGAAALAIAREQPIDVAFIDTGLTDMTGFDLARRIRETRATKRVRLIALADFASTDEIGTSRIAGFDLLLVKPVRLEQLVAALSLVQRLM
jgi:DNA-binding response OmpR family regulator